MTADPFSSMMDTAVVFLISVYPGCLANQDLGRGTKSCLKQWVVPTDAITQNKAVILEEAVKLRYAKICSHKLLVRDIKGHRIRARCENLQCRIMAR